MSEVLEGAVCGIDGCTPAASDHFWLASDAKATLAIEVISDAICPWCWIAKRRLNSAIAAIAPRVGSDHDHRRKEWTPFWRHRPARHFTSHRWLLLPSGRPGVTCTPAGQDLFAGAGVGHLWFDNVQLDPADAVGQPGRALAERCSDSNRSTS